MANPTFGGNVYTTFQLPIEAKVGLIRNYLPENRSIGFSSKQIYDLHVKGVRAGYIPTNLSVLAEEGIFDYTAYGGKIYMVIEAMGKKLEVRGFEIPDMQRWQNIRTDQGEVSVSESTSKQMNLGLGSKFRIMKLWLELDDMWVSYLAKALNISAKKIRQMYVPIKG